MATVDQGTIPKDWYAAARGSDTQALPRGMRIIKIGSSYRAIWGLGDGTWAWYKITAEDIKKLFPKGIVPDAELSNVGQFESRFGNNYWGLVSEINLKADTPWLDLDEKIANQFGFVPGFNEPEVRRLLQQSYFEGWDATQWSVQYRNTTYYKTHTDTQRQWVGLSQAEKNQLQVQELTRMKNRWRELYGTDPNPTQINQLNATALKIASGEMLFEQWDYGVAASAGARPGTPEFARREAAAVAAAAPANNREDLANFAEDQYREWVGPGTLPANFGTSWGNWLATGQKSEADLEDYLKTLSQSAWSMKPPELTWTDWASSYKSQIADVLELGTVDDADPLLGSILRSDTTGVDLEQMIRQDARFRSTNKMYGELSSLAMELGRNFGFVG